MTDENNTISLSGFITWIRTWIYTKAEVNALLSNISGGVSDYRSIELSASDYNPQIDSSVTITAIVKDMSGNPKENESVTLYCNGTSLSTGITNSNGVVTFTYTCSDWGMQDFSINQTHCQIYVDGWRVIAGSLNTTFAFLRNKTHGRFLLMGWAYPYSHNTTWQKFGTGNYAQTIRPKATVNMRNSGDTARWYIDSDGNVKWKAISGTIAANTAHNGSVEWAIRDEDL